VLDYRLCKPTRLLTNNEPSTIRLIQCDWSIIGRQSELAVRSICRVGNLIRACVNFANLAHPSLKKKILSLFQFENEIPTIINFLYTLNIKQHLEIKMSYWLFIAFLATLFYFFVFCRLRGKLMNFGRYVTRKRGKKKANNRKKTTHCIID